LSLIRTLKKLDKTKLYALQSLTLSGEPRHASLLLYSDTLDSWITIESTVRTRGRILSESTGVNIYKLDDVRGKNRRYNVYKIGDSYKDRDPSLNNWEFH